MRSHELVPGRMLGVTFDHGEDFFTALTDFCRVTGVRQGTSRCSSLASVRPKSLVPASVLKTHTPLSGLGLHLTNVEALGGGTIAYDEDADEVLPHIHITVGLKARSATAHTSHLLAATVQFLTEMLVIEVSGPNMRRVTDPSLYDVPLLRFCPPEWTTQSFELGA